MAKKEVKKLRDQVVFNYRIGDNVCDCHQHNAAHEAEVQMLEQIEQILGQ